MKQMGDRKANPLQFKHLKLCHYSMAGVNKVVLASMPMPYMEHGVRLRPGPLPPNGAPTPKTPSSSPPRRRTGSLARDLQDNGGDRTILIKVKRRVKLVGQELEPYISVRLCSVSGNLVPRSRVK